MKDLGAVKRILGMEIIRRRSEGFLYLGQTSYIEKLLRRFNMHEAKTVSTPIAAHFKLSVNQSPKTEEDLKYMASIPYSNATGSLMYVMVCSRPDLAYSASMVSRFMSNPGK